MKWKAKLIWKVKKCTPKIRRAIRACVQKNSTVQFPSNRIKIANASTVALNYVISIGFKADAYPFISAQVIAAQSTFDAVIHSILLMKMFVCSFIPKYNFSISKG